MNTLLTYNVTENPDASWTYAFSWPASVEATEATVVFNMPYNDSFTPSVVPNTWEWAGPVHVENGVSGFSFSDVRTPALGTVDFTWNGFSQHEPEYAWLPNQCVVPEPGAGVLVLLACGLILNRRRK